MNNTNITVRLEDGHTVVVSKLPLGLYAEVFGALEKLPQTLAGLDTGEKTNFLGQFPKLLAAATPEVAKILSVATKEKKVGSDGSTTWHTRIKPETIENEMGLDDATALLAAVLEVNQIEKVVENLKKMWSRTQSKPAIGSTEPSTPSQQPTVGAEDTSTSTSTQPNS